MFDTLFLESLSISNNYILYLNNAGGFKLYLYATAHSYTESFICVDIVCLFVCISCVESTFSI